MAWVRPPPPLPITNAMLAPANQNYDNPNYSIPADWSMGVVGNDVDISARSEPVCDASSARVITPYPIRTQTAKGAAAVPPLVPGVDIGKDYGTYAGQTGRTGFITPQAPYPDATSPPILTAVSPSTGGIAGGTAITITGAGLTGASTVTIGGTAATSITAVNASTVTATTPAKAAGAYDVIVTTPRGANATGTKFTYV